MTDAMRSQLIGALAEMISRYSWAHSFEAEEQITSTGVHAHVPMGPTQDASLPRTLEEGFLPRPGIPVLIVRVNVQEGLWRFYARMVETSIEFPEGSRTTELTRGAKLASIEVAIQAAFKRSRIA